MALIFYFDERRQFLYFPVMWYEYLQVSPTFSLHTILSELVHFQTISNRCRLCYWTISCRNTAHHSQIQKVQKFILSIVTQYYSKLGSLVIAALRVLRCP